MRKRMEMTSNCVKLLCIDTGAAPLLCHGETVSCGLRSSSSESEHVPNVSMEAAGKLCKSPQPCQPRLMPNTKNRTGSFCVVFIKWHGGFSKVMRTMSVVSLTLALTHSILSTPNTLNAFRSEKKKGETTAYDLCNYSRGFSYLDLAIKAEFASFFLRILQVLCMPNGCTELVMRHAPYSQPRD